MTTDNTPNQVSEVKTVKKSTKKSTTSKKAQPMTDTATVNEAQFAAVAAPPVTLESGILTDPSDLQYIVVDPVNVRNWNNYRLTVTEKTVDAPGEEFQRIVKEVEISGESDPRILELWNSLYSYDEETGKASYIVTTPLVLVNNPDGTKTPISGNTRAFLGQQLRDLQTSGAIDWDITYRLPYVINETLSVTDKILSQIFSNNGIPLTLWEQYDVIKLVAGGDVDNYRSIAKSVYPPKGGLAFRLAQMYDLSLQGYPVEAVRSYIPSFDTALKVFKAYEKLAATYAALVEVFPVSENVNEIHQVAITGKFSDKDLPALENVWKQALVDSGVAVEGFKAPKAETSETQEKEPKELPPFGTSWDEFEESYSVAVSALNQGALKDAPEDVTQELARLANTLNKALKKVNSLLFPKETAKAAEEPVEAPVTAKPAKASKAKKKAATEAPAAPAGPQPLPAETMAALEAGFQELEATAAPSFTSLLKTGGPAPTEAPAPLTSEEIEKFGLSTDLPE